jgi:hypothetical protein
MDDDAATPTDEEDEDDMEATGTSLVRPQAPSMMESDMLRRDAGLTASSVETVNIAAEPGQPQQRQKKVPKAPRTEAEGRAQHFIERDEERRRIHLKATQRAVWRGCGGRPHSPVVGREKWDDRHQVEFSNHNLHPNYRSYFDRRRVRRDDVLDELPGTMKPEWRLSNEPTNPEERNAMNAFLESIGARPTYTPKTMEVQMHGAVFSSQRSLVDPKYGLEATPIEDGSLLQDGSSNQAGEEVTEAMQVSASADSTNQGAMPEQVGAKARDKVETKSPSQSQSSWSDRHGITWCNERHTTGDKLNPVLLRSYFDRARTPHHSRCEVTERPMRVKPEWRLRSDAVTGEDMGRDITTASSNISSAVDVLKAPTRSMVTKGNTIREKRWNWRHELVFKNEEVDSLNRCYFDRWKEPEVNLPNERVLRNLKPNWCLEKVGSPEKTAEMLLESTKMRHTHHGAWNHRHERYFLNNIHTNMKSYFDRPREAEEMAGQRQRTKVTDREKLKVENWSLQEYSTGLDYHKTLRAESAPALPTSKKQRPARTWFSGHGVVF